jgi:gamma-tubulin complex component 3
MNSSTDNAGRVQKALLSLSRLLLRTDAVPADLLTGLRRLLRPADAQSASDFHYSALKHRLRASLLTQSINTNRRDDGPALVARLDRELEQLRRSGLRQLTSFLALLEPLSFRQSRVSSLLVSSSTTSRMVSEEDERWLDTGLVRPEGGDGAASSGAAGTAGGRAAAAQVEHASALLTWVSPEVELKLIKDLLFVFQGISGTCIKYDLRSEQYVIDPSLHLVGPVRDLVLGMCEMGWLYNKVAKYISKVEKTSINGLVSQSFGYAIQEELHDYYRLLAVLEQELGRSGEANAAPPSAALQKKETARRLAHGHSASLSGESKGVSGDPAVVSCGLSLIRLRVWLNTPLERMCLMARLVDGALPLQGGALAARLHGCAQGGDAASSLIVRRMLTSVCHPLYAVLIRWIMHGELIDTYKEFFIGINQEVSANGGSLWHDLYFIRSDMLPNFFSKDLAQKILVIGKSFNFLRACIHSGAWEKDSIEDGTAKLSLGGGSEGSAAAGPGGDAGGDALAAITGSAGAGDGGEARKTLVLNDEEMRHVEATLRALRYGDESRLEEIVGRVALLTDERLLKVMMDKAHLVTHLHALKNFMLLGQGDFVTCLMDSVSPELKKRASQLYRHNLTGILEGALRSCNAQYEPAYVLDKITVRLLEPSPGDTGWEIFSLDYTVDAPLTALIHDGALATYRTAFHMLWRLKRVEWSLSAAWKAQMSFGHICRDALPGLRPVLHRCALHRSRMIHFVNNLSAYLMFEVVESAWSALEACIAGAGSLDQVILAHDKYLGEIQDRALLSTQHEILNIQIQQVLQAILRFCSLEETLIADAHAILGRRQAAQREAGERSAAGGWGSSGREDGDGPDTLDGVSIHVVNRLDDAASNYDVQFNGLMKMLREKVRHAAALLLLYYKGGF